MTLNILLSAQPATVADYADPLRAALAAHGLGAQFVGPENPDQVDYIVYAPNEDLRDFTPFTRTRAVLSLWAGVDTIVTNPTLTQPLARMVDPGLVEGMVEWVTAHVLRHHLGLDRYIKRSAPHWDRHVPPLARDRRVSILGLGALGAAAAQALSQLGFPVTGWSRRPKSLPGITCLHGDDGLKSALQSADILVLLLPATPATENTLDAGTLALLPKGAVVINPGRGALIDDEALLAALDAGHIAHATLDALRIEPLPEDHGYWNRDDVTITPHIASETRVGTAVEVIAENIERVEAGKPLLHQVDRSAGY